MGKRAETTESAGRQEEEALLRRAYAAFNARDIEAAVALMHPRVDWPNGMEGGRVHGRTGVRRYWRRQFAVLDSHVEPERFAREADGRLAVDVRQVVRDLDGRLAADRMVQHVYRFRGGLVAHMEIREAPRDRAPSTSPAVSEPEDGLGA
jgi:ketosteroid isomerase-like protein